MSRAFPTVLGGCHPVPVGDDHRFGPESHLFGLLNEQGGAGGSWENEAKIGHSIAECRPCLALDDERRLEATSMPSLSAKLSKESCIRSNNASRSRESWIRRPGAPSGTAGWVGSGLWESCRFA
jgi:hypothetical protein